MRSIRWFEYFASIQPRHIRRGAGYRLPETAIATTGISWLFLLLDRALYVSTLDGYRCRADGGCIGGAGGGHMIDARRIGRGIDPGSVDRTAAGLLHLPTDTLVGRTGHRGCKRLRISSPRQHLGIGRRDGDNGMHRDGSCAGAAAARSNDMIDACGRRRLV